MSATAEPTPSTVIGGAPNASVDETPTSRSPVRDALRLLLAGGVGKAGVTLFTLLVLISIWVIATYPANFGNVRWSNPAIWADYPKAVPPVWMGWLSDSDPVRHTVQTRTLPTDVQEIPAGEIRLYEFPLDLNADEFPSLLSASMTGLTFHSAERPPVMTMRLVRPDGGTVQLGSLVAPNPRPGETAPYQRFANPSERIDLAAQDAAFQSLTQQVYSQLYPDLTYPTNLRSRLNEGLFGRPAEDGSGRIEVLPGEYTLVVQLVVPDPDDQLREVRTVMGGTVYGVMGTDTGGRDLREGLLYGFPIALIIAVMAATLSTLIGASLGIISGYAGGKTDTIIQRACDIISNVPTLPLLIFLVFILGSNLWLIILILVAFSWTGLTILVRSMVLQLRSGQLVESAKALGAGRRRIMTRHVFPQVAPYIVAQMIFFAPGAILAEASLSFLGLGDTSIPTWGQMLQAGFQTGALYVGYWWWVLPPGILIVVTALAFMLLALAMEPVVDPRLRRTNQ